jgi:uncharacterized protein YbjT (DUF2867 family)
MSTSNESAASRPTILVTGATGAQGGSVARYLLERGAFAVRALTRNPDSDAAKALAAAGAEVVRGDLDDAASLRAAVASCHGVFGVTNFWEHFEAEHRHGVNLIDAVAESDVRHFVLSTLPSAHDISGGELSAPHLDIKAKLEAYARERGLPATFVHVAYYFENFASWFVPRRQEDGTYAFGFPQGDTPLAGVAVEDVGGVVAPIFERRDEFLGRTVGIVGDDLTGDEYAAVMGRVLGRPIAYHHIPREVFAGFGFPGADDLANMFDFNRRFIPNRQADLAESRALFPQIQSFDRWMEANRARFEAALA